MTVPSGDRFPRLLLLLLATFLLTGCQTARFYTQAAHGQFEILRRQQPIARILGDPAQPQTLKTNLARIRVLTQFAATSLHLPSEGSYTRFADLGRPHVVWNVFAADEFSTEAKTWWYPLVGRLKYQGYFQEALARQYADRLAVDGFDVHVAPVSAYSTLGWLKDPVLNTWAGASDTALAELIFHELTHRRLFIHGDTDFNEAFASATARICVRRWLASQGRAEALAAYQASVHREDQLIEAVRRTRSHLAQLYESLPPEQDRGGMGAEQRETWRARKHAMLQQLQMDFPGTFPTVPNNAWLAEIDTYGRLVPAFERYYERHGSDLELYFNAVQRLGSLSKAKRLEALTSAPQSVETQSGIRR